MHGIACEGDQNTIRQIVEAVQRDQTVMRKFRVHRPALGRKCLGAMKEPAVFRRVESARLSNSRQCPTAQEFPRTSGRHLRKVVHIRPGAKKRDVVLQSLLLGRRQRIRR